MLKSLISHISSLKKRDIFFLLVALCCAGKYLIADSWEFHANDFAPIYAAAQLVAEGKTASIYDHHPYLFNVVPPGEFKHTAEKIGFTGFLHPYVHLPLVSYLFHPFLSIPYRTMSKLLLAANILSLLLSLYLILILVGVERTLRWLSCALALLCFFYPLRYSLRLGQTSPLIFLGITLVIYLSHTGHLKTAGVILGGIISLKITPIFFLLYFLIRKKRSLVLSTLITVLVIGLSSILLVGWESNLFFFQNLVRLSGVSLASWNNQSLDGFLLRLITQASHIYDWHLLELSSTMKLVKLFILSSVFMLWFTIIFRSPKQNEGNRDLLDFSLTLMVLVVFTPISWSHYLLFLVFPYMVLLSALTKNKTMPYRYLMIGGLLLSYPGIALPPPYFLLLVNVPLLNKVPISLLCSLGFFSGILLIVIIIFYIRLIRKTNFFIPGKLGESC